MFGNKDVGSNGAKRNGFSVLGPDVGVTGDIDTDSDLHVDGTILGDVRCGTLVQTVSGKITGAVCARSARIAGTIEGSVSVDDLVIEASARVAGDIAYATIAIEAGAKVEGALTRALAEDARPIEPVRLISAAE